MISINDLTLNPECMGILEALSCVNHGYRVARNDWKDGHYIVRTVDMFNQPTIVNADGTEVDPLELTRGECDSWRVVQ